MVTTISKIYTYLHTLSLHNGLPISLACRSGIADDRHSITSSRIFKRAFRILEKIRGLWRSDQQFSGVQRIRATLIPPRTDRTLPAYKQRRKIGRAHV